MGPTMNDVEKLAEAMGWMKAERLGRTVWYDPSGGHVYPTELKDALDRDLDALMEDCEKHPQLRIDDAVALARLGNPFQKT